jgi:hypothetical protein
MAYALKSRFLTSLDRESLSRHLFKVCLDSLNKDISIGLDCRDLQAQLKDLIGSLPLLKRAL